jgi:mannose/fructose/N-acetylgalactosamine-specific phosphotransferase system component IIB
VPIALFRVDERLIHGQVTMGWGSVLRARHYLVVDDELAGSEWERELYRLGTPSDADAVFLTVEEAKRDLPTWAARRDVTILLTRDVDTMLRLARAGALAGEEVTLGGIHHAPGREQVLPYLYLGPDERAGLRDLRREGVAVVARDLPGAPRTEVDRLLE